MEIIIIGLLNIHHKFIYYFKVITFKLVVEPTLFAFTESWLWIKSLSLLSDRITFDSVFFHYVNGYCSVSGLFAVSCLSES